MMLLGGKFNDFLSSGVTDVYKVQIHMVKSRYNSNNGNLGTVSTSVYAIRICNIWTAV